MRWLAALLAAVIGVAVAAPSARAHATVVRTVPADTAVLQAAPRAVSMRFSEPVDIGSLRLLDANGAPVGRGQAVHAGGDPATAVLALPGGLRDGTYVVAWRVTSADSHPVSGAFSFSVGKPSATVAAGQAGPSSLVTALDGAARAVAFGGFALAVGGACLLLVLWPGGPASRRAVWIGVGALAAGTLAVLLLQGPSAGTSLGFTLSTRFGRTLLARLALAAAFAVAVARGRRGAAGACAVAMVLTWTLSDHSRTGVQTWLGVPAATVHLLAMALWLGGLALLVGYALRRDAALERVLPRFSRLALGCFAALALTGGYLAWRQSGVLDALPATEYGRLLLVKSAIVLAIVALGALSRRAVLRRGAPRLTVAVEIVLGAAVLGVTAALVNAEPARVAYARPVDATARGPAGTSVQLHMERTKPGSYVADVFLLARGGGLYVPPEVRARLMTDGVAPLRVNLSAAEPGHYVASRLAVPFPARWKLELTVRTSDFDESVVTIPVRL